MGGEAEAAGFSHSGRDLRPAQTTAHRPIDPEGEEVVAVRRRYLGAHEHQHLAVPALLAALARREGVVVGEQHCICARARGCLGYLRHRARAVRIGRVHVHHAHQLVQLRRAHRASVHAG
jgi:hypothetical protein